MCFEIVAASKMWPNSLFLLGLNKSLPIHMFVQLLKIMVLSVLLVVEFMIVCFSRSSGAKESQTRNCYCFVKRNLFL